jgi:glycosyltransferase involved in cell wall biosynthesis
VPERALMLGHGWFPDSIGGLERYYRSLFEQLGDARGVVIGPAADAPRTVRAPATAQTSLPIRLLGYARAARELAREAELVDAHFALYALVPLRSRALRRRPVVFHFHGPWADENVAAGDGSRVKLGLRRAVERGALSHADAIVVLSGAFRRLLVERYRVAPWDVHVWAPGVDLERFSPGDRARARERLGIPGDAFVALCARRMVPRMGVEVLLDAWQQLHDRLPGPATLLLVGDGPLIPELRTRVADGPLADSVRVLGRVPDGELPNAYRAADVAVVPTIAFEGYGLVVLEAAACGTPSVVSDIGGLPEVAGPLERSLVIPAGDIASLRERLAAAAAGSLPSRERTRAYAERFRWQPLADRHRKLYRSLLEGRRDTRLRVVYLDHVARLSGGEIALLRLLPHLEQVNAHVILGEQGPLAERLVQAGVSVEVMPLAAGARDLRKDRVGLAGTPPAALLSTALYTLRLAWRLRRLKPDLVHTNSLKSGVYGALAARAARAPVVWHLRDRISPDYLPRAGVGLIRSLVPRLAGAVIANSESTLATLGRPRREQLREVIPDSVARAQRQQIPAARQQLTFGMLGRIAPWKGQELFLRAFAAAFGQGSERAVVVGAPMFGEEDYEREMHKLAEQLALAGRVEFRGFREDIWSELEQLDVLVHASVIPEPFGQVVLEGMAAGLPVIAPDEGGPADIISDGHTGLLFASRDQDALAAAMLRLRADPQERALLGATAREAVAAYHPEVIAARLQTLYARVLASSGERPR